ncbi:MAG TPA: hypothetical protein VFP63_03200 [Dehalococcoidia bacterium]|nr:hypothetical protein [Dehalococcoidia bacterium]
MKKRQAEATDLAAYLQNHRGDDDEWEGAPEEAAVEKTPSVVYSFRLRSSELAELRRAAKAKGMALSELVRTAAIEHIRESDVLAVDVSAAKIKFFTRYMSPSAGTRGPSQATVTLPRVRETATA